MAARPRQMMREGVASMQTRTPAGIVEELEQDLRREEYVLRALEQDLVAEHRAAQRLERGLERLRESLPEERLAAPEPELSGRLQTFVTLLAVAMVVVSAFAVGMGVEGRTSADLQTQLGAVQLQATDLITVATELSLAQAAQLGASLTAIREGRGWITPPSPFTAFTSMREGAGWAPNDPLGLYTALREGGGW